MGRRTRRQPVLRVAGAEVSRRTETLAVEEPLEIRLAGRPFQVTMRTPGEDIDLVHGLLHAEQIVTGAGQISLARYCDGAGPDGLNTYNVLDVTLADGVVVPDGLQRNVLTSSACGVCGTATIDQVARASRFGLDTGVRVAARVAGAAPERLRAGQRLFDQTGGLHAAGLLAIDDATLEVREDVGRHNAVDKVIGWAIRRDLLPLSRMILCVSGRASFELTQKAVLAGVEVMVAVSAPSSLAVELADRTGLTLVGFVRAGQMNVYTHPERIVTGQPAEPAPAAAPGGAAAPRLDQ